ncbi:UBX domain-containing protein 11 isoform X2 [Narcine bancroftii]|uniref:UBX domain-containing protein 11 isoform X2 n=1 Tax=Narcine bancroftii TaxID=1343680 RepID=UPI003831AC85
MSSPLSSLGKLRKVSLNLPQLQGRSKQVLCFEENFFTDSSPSDNELMSTMMKRLTKMEQQVRNQAQEISRKNLQIAMLKEKLRMLQLSKTDDPRRQQELEKCLQLQNQKFLNDYGMIWVGGGKKNEACSVFLKEEERQECPNASGPVWHPGDATVNSFRIEYDLVLQNIKDLNILAGEGEAAIEPVLGGARLKRPDPIPLTLFKNGIVMFNGPFRSFSQPSTQQCLQDIMDGYFPSELQSRYPNGVPIQVNDRRDVIFRERRECVEFPGVGQKVEDNPGDKGSKQQNFEFVKVTNEVSDQKLSVEQFLHQLPKTIIRAGKAFDIRGEIKTLLQIPPKATDESITLIETPCLLALKERLEVREEFSPTLRNTSTLRIKSENGEKTYIIKMFLSETIGDLRAYMDQSREKQKIDYDIISTFPQKIYSDQSKTLKDYGLVPNATLILRPRRQQILNQQLEMVTPLKE